MRASATRSCWALGLMPVGTDAAAAAACSLQVLGWRSVPPEPPWNVSAHANRPDLCCNTSVLRQVYVWGRRHQYVNLSFLGIFNFTAPYLPWVLLAFSVILGSSPVVDLLGMVAGVRPYPTHTLLVRGTCHVGKAPQPCAALRLDKHDQPHAQVLVQRHDARHGLR